ncbi:MAG: cyclic nucleotide-binding domain-containing protein, partial [Proteobacteria bacterium]|nr:cyclic nucleotide-binding domain-containing protein [Pseudomonadota bacterium]
ENKKNYLLSALPIVSDELKEQLVVQLGQLGGGDTSEVFLDLFANRDSFAPHVRDELLKKIIINLRLSNSIRAVNLLNMFVEERKEIYNPNSDSVVKVARQTLHILNPRFGREEVEEQVEVVEEEVEKIIAFENDPVSRNLAKRNLQRVNEEVTILLGKGKVSEASLLLYEKSIEAAKEKDFDSAEMLRDRILEVDPNALTEVIRAGECIEEERSSAISSHHLSIWQDLYDALTTEEFNALYYILQEKNYPPGDTIVEQGMATSCLYFINSGQVRLSCLHGRDEIFLKRVNPGEIIGASPFFNVSVWTVTLTALTETQVHVLERDKFLELLEQFPGLESCLHDYCTRLDTVPELVKMSGADRRQAARYPLSLFVKHTLLDKYGNLGKRSFKGELADISTGGLSFFIRISRKENARLLLGRMIKTSITLDQGEVVNCIGHIVAVRFQQYVESDYSVHVQFKEPIETGTIKQIVRMHKQKKLD